MPRPRSASRRATRPREAEPIRGDDGQANWSDRFELAIQYAFSGYTALAPLIVAALFWKRSTKWGALACAIWAVIGVIAVAVFQSLAPAPAPGPSTVVWSAGGLEVLSRTAGGTAIFGLMPVVPMALISALLMFVVSMLTARPSAAAIARYFPKRT